MGYMKFESMILAVEREPWVVSLYPKPWEREQYWG